MHIMVNFYREPQSNYILVDLELDLLTLRTFLVFRPDPTPLLESVDSPHIKRCEDDAILSDGGGRVQFVNPLVGQFN